MTVPPSPYSAPPSATKSVSVAAVTAPGGLRVTLPLLALGPQTKQEPVHRWVQSVCDAWTANGDRVVRVDAGPEEMRDSPARKMLLTDIVTATVQEALAQMHGPTSGGPRILLVIDVGGAYEHSGSDSDLTGDLTLALDDAFQAAQVPGGPGLVVIASALSDVPDQMARFPTLVTSMGPSGDYAARGLSLSGVARPSGDPPAGYVWIGADGSWEPRPVASRRTGP